MEMFLMALALSVLGVAVSSIMFVAATRTDGSERPESEMRPVETLAPSQFFVHRPEPAARVEVPIEALLLQIERHVSLEQAAAESFLNFPTSDSLHSRTMSPLVH